MIIDELLNCHRYAELGPTFGKAFGFLKNALSQPASFTPGKYPVHGNDVVATLSELSARDPQAAIFERHVRFADVHVCLQGEEYFGWQHESAELKPDRLFDPAADIETYRGHAHFTLPLCSGYFAIVLPGELHAPALGYGPIKKWVVKVRYPTPSVSDVT